jgi:hypothetical protein
VPRSADADALADALLDVVGRDNVEERHAGRLQALRTRTRDLDFWIVWRVVNLGKTQRQPHVARAPFGVADAGNSGAPFGVFQDVAVFDLEAEKDLAVRIERPDVGSAHLFFRGDAPHLGGVELPAVASQAFLKRPSSTPRR